MRCDECLSIIVSNHLLQCFDDSAKIIWGKAIFGLFNRYYRKNWWPQFITVKIFIFSSENCMAYFLRCDHQRQIKH
ncbi:hypothetical protein AD953_04725 [Acetobacter malorum]|uniref:Uncharacterized protein n=1 Tax=Acetobacter malorum TaxID=178901 RepID=A0A149VBN6_9PROT|nr:hypothetical protein AD953_04725 [Acetobacter malorum]